jgi:hypothetical protein
MNHFNKITLGLCLAVTTVTQASEKTSASFQRFPDLQRITAGVHQTIESISSNNAATLYGGESRCTLIRKNNKCELACHGNTAASHDYLIELAKCPKE